MKRFGFTLIELLVVLAIISLLAALILPVLRMVRVQAQTTNCRSNLGQIGTAMMLYANEYNEYLCNAGSSTWGVNYPAGYPGAKATVSPDCHIDWNTWTYTGCPSGQTPPTCSSWSSYTYDWPELYTPYTEGIEIFIDPGMKKWGGRFTQPGLTADGSIGSGGEAIQGSNSRVKSYYSDYEVNWCLLNSWNEESKRWTAASMAQIKWADSVVAMQCGRLGYDTSWTFMPNFSFSKELGSAEFGSSTDGGPNAVPNSAWLGLRLEGVERGKLVHKDKMNFLFIDGHVKLMGPEKDQRDWHYASAERHWELTRQYIEPEP